jgi:hypothetical protein
MASDNAINISSVADPKLLFRIRPAENFGSLFESGLDPNPEKKQAQNFQK